MTGSIPSQPRGHRITLVWAGTRPDQLPWESVDCAARAPGGAVYLWDLPEELGARIRAILAEHGGAGNISVSEVSGEAAVPGGLPAPADPEAPQIVFFSGVRAPAVRALAEEEAAVRLVPSGLDLRKVLTGTELEELYELTRTLRSECPWDREQTQADIVSYTMEEVYELVDAVRHPGETPYPEVRGELGDLLFQVYFLAQVAEEEGWYDLGDVARGIRTKLIERHPHIFAEGSAETPQEVRETWDEIKRRSEGREGVFAEVPTVLPALLLARKVQQRAAGVGFDWTEIREVVEKVEEETGELAEELEAMESGAVSHEIGDMLFAVVNLARRLGVDPELALRESSRRFRERVEEAVRLADQDGRSFAALDIDSQEVYYQRAKEGLLRGR